MAPRRHNNYVKTVVWRSKKSDSGIVIVAKSLLKKYEGSGSLLDTKNSKVWEDFSPIEAHLLPDVEITKDDVKIIAGDDFKYIWPVLKKVLKGIPVVRYTIISSLNVNNDQGALFLKGIMEDKNIVLVNEETYEEIEKGSNRIKLGSSKGRIPLKYVDRKVDISSSVREISEGFEANIEDLPYERLRAAPKVAVRVNEVFRVKVFDREHGRFLYFLVFNQGALDNGKDRLSALGGGRRFKEGGLSYYRRNVDPQIRTIPGEDPLDVRVIIRGENLDKMLGLLNRGVYIEDNVDHELIDELNGENGLFPRGVPEEWLSGPRDRAMRSLIQRVLRSLNSSNDEVGSPDSKHFFPLGQSIHSSAGISNGPNDGVHYTPAGDSGGADVDPKGELQDATRRELGSFGIFFAEVTKTWDYDESKNKHRKVWRPQAGWS